MEKVNNHNGNSDDQYYLKARDMWIRARSNAFAHKLAAGRLKIYANISFTLQTLFVVLPIICVGLALQMFSVSANPPTNPPILVNYFSSTTLSILAIISNGLALFISIISVWFQWSDRAKNHLQLLSGYQLIAQKARRLENKEIPQDERSHLCRHLEETFEIYKTMGIEPIDEIFEKANGLMRKVNVYPFGLTKDSLFDSRSS